MTRVFDTRIGHVSDTIGLRDRSVCATQLFIMYFFVGSVHSKRKSHARIWWSDSEI